MERTVNTYSDSGDTFQQAKNTDSYFHKAFSKTLWKLWGVASMSVWAVTQAYIEPWITEEKSQNKIMKFFLTTIT